MTTDRIITFPSTGDEHLSYEEMERWVDGHADAEDRELVQTHIEHCKTCRDEIVDLTASRDTLRQIQPRRAWKWAAAAAIALFVIGAAAFWSVRRAPAVLRMPEVIAALNPAAGTERGQKNSQPRFTLLQPVGTLVADPQPVFRWTALPRATSYMVTVADAETGSVAVTAFTSATEWSPSEPLPRGRTYSWQVKARAPGATVVEPQPPQREALFRVASDVEAGEWRTAAKGNHRSAGVGFAEHGFLDDAERELQLASASGDARAASLLAQVRSWRATATRR